MADFRIRVIIDPTGSQRGGRQVERQLNRIGNSADRVRNLIAGAFAFAGLSIGIRGLVELADTFTNIQNRLRTVTDGTQELALVTDELFEISNRTRSSFEATAEVYARVGLATRELGISQGQTLAFTESLNQAVILSGASAQEAQAGLIQLSQGLASGALRGDELRSVLEQLPVVADVIAESMGITRGALREMGAEGAITADIVLNAFAEAREELAERFGETIPTISQSLQVLRNNAIGLVGAFDSASGVSQALSRAILFLSENLETVIRAVGALAIALGIQFAARAVPAAIAGLAKLAIAIALNPIGAIATAIVLATGALIAFGDQLSLTGTGAATALDFMIVAFFRLWDAIQIGVNFVVGLFTGFQNTIDDFTFMDFVNAGARAVDALIGVFTGGFDAVKAIWDDFPRVIGDIIISGLNFVLRNVERFINGIIQALNRIPGVAITTLDGVIPQLENPFEGAAANVGRAATEGFARGFDQALAQNLVADIATEAEERAQARVAQEAEELAALEAARAGLGVAPAGAAGGAADTAFQDLLANLELENELLQLNTTERERRQALLAFEADLERELTEAERAQVEALILHNEELQRQSDLFDAIRGPAQEMEADLRALEALYESGKIELEEYNEVLNELRLQALEFETTAGAGLERFFRTVAAEAQTSADFIEDSLGAVFDNLTSTLEEFANTGKFSFTDFTNSILRDLNRLAAQGVSDQIAGIFGSIFGGGGGGGGGAGFGNIFGSIVSGIGGLFGFANGGSFDIGGRGGVDNNVMSINGKPIARVSRGETVDISPNGGGGRPIQVIMNIQTPDADSFQRSQDQILARVQAQLSRAGRRNA